MLHEDEVPAVVYHYTSIDTLLKLVRSRQIWATSVKYLNDTSERELFLKRAEERLPILLTRLINNHPDEDEDVTLVDVTKLATNTLGATPNGPFIASFSAHEDSLPQWRAYCPNGNGVSVGFRVKALQRVLMPASTRARLVPFRRVRYLQPSSTEDLDLAILDAYERAVSSGDRFLENDHLQSWSLGTEFVYKLREQATLYKDQSFSHESEFRLIVDSVFERYDLLSFRATRSSLVPFLALTLPSSGELVTAWDAVISIKLGPNANAELTAEAMNQFVRSQHLDATVSVSNIPFRDWL